MSCGFIPHYHRPNIHFQSVVFFSSSLFRNSVACVAHSLNYSHKKCEMNESEKKIRAIHRQNVQNFKIPQQHERYFICDCDCECVCWLLFLFLSFFLKLSDVGCECARAQDSLQECRMCVYLCVKFALVK